MLRDLQGWASMSHVYGRQPVAPVSDALGGIRRARAHRRFPYRRRGSRLFPSRRRHCPLRAGRSSPAGYRPWQLPHFGADRNSSAEALGAMVRLLSPAAPPSTNRVRAEGADGPRHGNQRPLLGTTPPNASPRGVEFVGGIARRTRFASRGQPQCTLTSCSSRWPQALQRGQAQGRVHHRSVRSDQRRRILGSSCRVHRSAGNEIPGPGVSAPGRDDSSPVPGKKVSADQLSVPLVPSQNVETAESTAQRLTYRFEDVPEGRDCLNGRPPPGSVHCALLTSPRLACELWRPRPGNSARPVPRSPRDAPPDRSRPPRSCRRGRSDSTARRPGLK